MSDVRRIDSAGIQALERIKQTSTPSKVDMQAIVNVLFDAPPRLSELVQLMLDGLDEAHARPDFHISMGSWGEAASSGTCWGCAATAALSKLVRPFRAEDENFGNWCMMLARDLTDEKHIEPLRWALICLAEWYNDIRTGVNALPDLQIDHAGGRVRPRLTTESWQNDLRFYRAWVADLKQAGH